MYSTYVAAYGNGAASTVGNYGRLIQIPATATAVLLPYKETGVTSLNLTTSEVCRIFSFDPSARAWNQVTSPADDGGTGSASAIRLVYNAGQSGTTYLLSRYLNAACSPYLPAGRSFTVSGDFKTVVASALATPVGTTNPDGLPDAWISAFGDGGVSAAMVSDHRLSYISPDPIYTGTANAVVARIDGFLPTATAIQAALPAPPATTIARANPLNWVPAYTYNAGSYPIYGTTNLLVGQCYAAGSGPGSAAAAVWDFLNNLNNGTYDAYIAAHNLVKLPAAWNAAIMQAFLNGGTLGLNSTSVCTGGIGR